MFNDIGIKEIGIKRVRLKRDFIIWGGFVGKIIEDCMIVCKDLYISDLGEDSEDNDED